MPYVQGAMSAELAKKRLMNQQFVAGQFLSATELVGWLGAVQAQEYAQTKWGLGLRLPHLSDKDIEQEFLAGNILRTHLLRPTWHFVTAQDIRWLLKLTAPRVHQANAFMYRKLELDKSIFRRSNDIIGKTLEGQKFLTRDAINEELKANGLVVQGDRLSYVMMAAELDGLICSGPRQGNQFTYALLEERIPVVASLSRDEALAELANRYFTSRGPATLHDFSTWSGLTLADCRKSVQLNSDRLTKYVIDTVDFYAAEGTSYPANPGNDMHLLPMYDEWIMGYKDRSATLTFRSGLPTIPPFRFGNLIMSNGQIIGTWKRTIGSKFITVDVDFFVPLTNQQRNAFDLAIQRLERFSNLPVRHT
ncbi:winged helix DNA-binding domain-containing protein [Spirosoma sp. KNUC1025]|uniref:winged helix DNA-binding domain-containing protein n=1 Tax=Spirosoma sp. KNUC1025 TaxID=2894082 RepID=UPI003869CE52|nr:winged helix DNA-binding domain-containing protein [Spirosoma sp. KNUC1025]